VIPEPPSAACSWFWDFRNEYFTQFDQEHEIDFAFVLEMFRVKKEKKT
jgi:hypothetical protein